MGEKRYFLIKWDDGKPKFLEWYTLRDEDKARAEYRKIEDAGELPELLITAD